ncbi:MAG: hypothetical protein ACOX2W_10015 [Desulfomonilia bacterium]|nr:hypothetical protein [Desulfomonilia bacterium]
MADDQLCAGIEPELCAGLNGKSGHAVFAISAFHCERSENVISPDAIPQGNILRYFATINLEIFARIEIDYFVASKYSAKFIQILGLELPG